MSNKNLELCECLRCKRNGIDKYVHPTTKWRHSKKRKYNIELIDDDIIDESYDEYNSYNEESYREDNEEKSKSYNEEKSEFHNEEESFNNKTDDEEELIVSESENNSLNLEGSLKDRTLLENINLTTVEHNITNEVAKGLRLLEIKVRHNIKYISRNIDGTIGDVFDGAQYKNLLQKGYFQDDRDIVLLGSVDGYQLFKQKCDDCWIILFINANLPPEQRVKKENLLITSIIPGPKAPKDFNSFLKPVVDELCLLEGIYNNHIYYPTTPPSDANNTNETYDPSNLPRRMHSDYVTRIGQIVTIELLRTRELLASNLGVVGRSVLLDIRSTQFPACFPVDIMHLFYENVAPYMLRHWMGSFFKDSTLNNQPYTLNNKQWSEIGANMDAIKKSIPTEFGRPPRNIFRHYSGYKAEEWASWITLYSLPLLKDQLPSVYLKGVCYCNFITIMNAIIINGQIIGSEWIRRNKDWARINYTVLTRDDSSTQFIDVTAIDRCVGFMKLGCKTYIIDKEYMEE
ncbi:transposase domain-containing protein [Rhizophagus clarus]|uniref:Transposase domain-containing protein n=2 Tax=Rhizophagus clarus TaxID=94130 RepID=A0A8H3LY56_9GLOM|nr:transposase domain-containing protein [Rhizophagus clarus]